MSLGRLNEFPRLDQLFCPWAQSTNFLGDHGLFRFVRFFASLVQQLQLGLAMSPSAKLALSFSSCHQFAF